VNRREILFGGVAAATTVGVKKLWPWHYTPDNVGTTYSFPSDGTIKTYIRKYRGQEYELAGMHDWEYDMMKFKVYWRDMSLPLNERKSYALGCYGSHRIPNLETAICHTIDTVKFKDSRNYASPYAPSKPEGERIAGLQKNVTALYAPEKYEGGPISYMSRYDS